MLFKESSELFEIRYKKCIASVQAFVKHLYMEFELAKLRKSFFSQTYEHICMKAEICIHIYKCINSLRKSLSIIAFSSDQAASKCCKYL